MKLLTKLLNINTTSGIVEYWYNGIFPKKNIPNLNGEQASFQYSNIPISDKSPAFIQSFIHPFIHPSIHPFIHSSIPSSIHPFIHSFIHSFILLILFGSNILSAQNCTSRLDINTNEQESIIYVNGKIVGYGSASLELEKGEYFITAKNKKLTWDAQIFRDSIEIDHCNSNKVIFYNFRNEIYINSQPGNASVLYKDSLLGYTPLHLLSTLDQIEISKKGYKTELIKLKDEQKTYNVNLNFNGITNSESFFKTNLFKILIGTAVALGGTAAYYKLQADNNFELYNQTKEQKYLDRTDQYDTISGIAFGALQINFGVLIYYFLTD